MGVVFSIAAIRFPLFELLQLFFHFRLRSTLCFCLIAEFLVFEHTRK